MPISVLILFLTILAMVGFAVGRNRGLAFRDSAQSLHSLPNYHGTYVMLMTAIPACFVALVWLSLESQLLDGLMKSGIRASFGDMDSSKLNLLISEIRNYAITSVSGGAVRPQVGAIAESYARSEATSRILLAVAVAVAGAAGLYFSLTKLDPAFRARNRVERIVKIIMICASMFAILITIGIVLSLIFETIRFFGKVPLTEFLFGLKWSPQTALRAEQVGGSGAFGAVPLFAGTLLITLIAMCVAVPIGLFSAIYMSEYASPRIRATAKPILEILAGIPTVVYGFFAALTVAPAFRGMGESFGLDVASESALAAGVVMGVMIIPFVSSLSDDVMNAVPQTLRDGSYALGATKSETIRQVVLPAALPGIVGSVLLAVSRAIGETMIVVMAAGLAANLTINPLEAVTTVTVQMVTLLVGDQEFDSAKTLAAFALGLSLFIITLVLNIVALKVVQRYRERYD